MPQEEYTGRREGPSNYSKWHRKSLPGWCYMVDGDWFEMRVRDGALKPIAYIETVEVDNPWERLPLWKATKALVCSVVERIGIPIYVVWHNAECNRFSIWKVLKNGDHLKEYQRMTREEYDDFIKNL